MDRAGVRRGGGERAHGGRARRGSRCRAGRARGHARPGADRRRIVGNKVVLFGAYVAFALRVLLLPGYPFAVSFAIYFVMFYACEALWLSRLARQAPDARS